MRSAFLGPFRLILAVLGLSTGLLGSLPTCAAAAETSQDRELAAAYQGALAAMVPGPGSVKLLDQAVIKLDQEDGFVPREQAVRLMRALGNPASPAMLGVILPRNGHATWFFTLEFEKLGFTPPKVLAALDKDQIYQHMQRATERANAQRAKLGSAKLELGEFVDLPFYDAKLDRMFMATHILQSGPSDGGGDSINVKAYVFGREGVLTLGLATHQGGYANLRHHMDQLYSSASFLPGKRSADVGAADKRVEYPLEMLFGGLAAEEVAKEKAAASERAKQLQLLENERQEADRDWQLYMIAAAASLLLSGMAVFAFSRATAA